MRFPSKSPAQRPFAAIVALIGLFVAMSGIVPLASSGQGPRVPAVAAAVQAPELPPLTEAPPEPAPSPMPEPTASPVPTPSPSATPAEAAATPAPTPAPAVEAAAPTARMQSTSVCHYTGSNAAPYVLVQAPPGGGEHAAHGDDIIPAPAGGCPATYQGPQPPRATPTPAPTATSTPSPQPADEVTLCHATGDRSRPYVELTVLRNRVNEHRRHRGDIIPAPEGGCPARAQQPDDDDDEVPPPQKTPKPAPQKTPEPLLPEPDGGGGSRPEAETAPAPVPTPTPAPAPAAAEAVTGLADTGNRSGLAILFGLGLMSSGAGLRLLAPRP